MKRSIGGGRYVEAYSDPQLGNVIDIARGRGYKEDRGDKHGIRLTSESSGLAYIISSESTHTLWVESARRR